jgi:hypothetical protein
MGQRNYVAKYAQRSGAGPHKRKDKAMASYPKEDWVYIEDYNAEVEYLNSRKQELEQVVQDQDDDARYILSLILALREHAVGKQYWDVVGQCDYIVGLHSATDYVEALKLFKKEVK